MKIRLASRCRSRQRATLKVAPTSMLGYQIKAEYLHNVMEFKGVGKEVWAGVDVEKYIEEERNSWER